MSNSDKFKYKKSNYNIFFDIEGNEKIIFNTRTLALSIINNNEYIKYLDVDKDSHSLAEDSILCDMYKNGYIIDVELDELEVLRNRLNKIRYSKEDLKLTIAPTINCNFDCTYCYEKQGVSKNSKIMDEKTQELLINFIEKKIVPSKNVEIIWYGGEPLLAFDIIKNMSKKIIDICNSKNATYSASIITNGYLLDKYTVKDFKDLMINDMQITIDGPEKIHNSRRLLKNGNGTYSKIIENIRSFQDEIFTSVRINVDKENLNFLDDLISDFSSEGITNSTMSLALVKNLENPNDSNCIKVKDFTSTWLEFNKKCKNRGLKTPSDLIPSVAHYCDADCENSFLIDNLGYIYKCWNDIGDPSRSISNLITDTNLNVPLFYNYISYDATQDDNCKNCEYLPICMGGCPYDRLNTVHSCVRYKYCLQDVLTELISNYEKN